MIFMPFVAMLLLAFQWGGHTYVWSFATIIGLLCGFAVMMALFVAWLGFKDAEANILADVFLQRSVLLDAAVGFFLWGHSSLPLTIYPFSSRSSKVSVQPKAVSDSSSLCSVISFCLY